MLDLKIADLYADLTIRMAAFNRQLGQIHNRLASFNPPPITVNANTTAATARMNLLLQQIKAVQAQAQARINVGIGGGSVGRAGIDRGGVGGGYRGPGGLTGLGQGLGVGYLANPVQAAGVLAGAGLKEAVGTAIELEAKFAEVRRVAGLSADQTERLKRELMAISTVQPGATLDDLVKMADIGGRMGLAGKDLTTFASGLAMVKNSVSGMETEDLANNMSRVLHVFQLGPEYIKGFGSALTAMDNATTASAADILKITQGLSGTAAAINLTLPQVIALSAALRDVGLTPELASSSFSQIFRKMATNLEGFATAAGVSAQEFADAYRRGPMDALTMLMKGLEKTKDTIETQELLKGLGLQGIRAGGSLMQLGQAFDKVAGLTRTANGEFTTLDSLLAADALKGETTAAALGKLGNAATGLADAFGSRLLPDIKAVTDALLQLANAGNRGEAALAALRGGGNAGDWLVNKLGPGDTLRQIAGQVPGMLPGGRPGQGAPLGRFNGFQRITDMVLGKPVTPAPGAAAKAPALPVKPASVPSSTGNANAESAHKAGEDFFAALRNRIGVAKVVGGVFADSIRQDAAKLPGMFEGPKTGSALVGVSGSDFGRQRQADILNGGKNEAKETARNTSEAAKTLVQMLVLAKQGGKQVINALKGP